MFAMNYLSRPRLISLSYQFCKCDVTSWQDQLAVFKAAVANSPEKSLDVVIANAGTGGRDSILQLGNIPLPDV